MQIFITRGEDSSGPYSLEQVQDYLSQGMLLPDDLAYYEGLEGWIRLEQLIAEATPLEEPPHPALLAQASSPVEPELTTPKASSAPVKGKGKSKLIIAAVVGLLVLSGLSVGVWILLKEDPDKQAQQQPPADKPSPPANTSETNTNLPPSPTPNPSNPEATPPKPPEPELELTPEEVADLFADDIGKWKVTGKNMPVGSDPEPFEDTIEIRWKVEGKSTVATFSPLINGEIVPFVGHKEYDAKEGVFIWRSKGVGFPETVSREHYDLATKTYRGKSTHPEGAKETSTFEIVSKDKRLFTAQVEVDGKVVFSREAVFTRIDESKPPHLQPASGSLGENIIGKRFVCQAPGNKEALLQFEKDGTLYVAGIEGGKILLEGDELTYRVDGLEVRVTENGKENGGVTFASNNPKRGDKLLVGHHARIIKRGDKILVGGEGSQKVWAILRIEPAAPLGNTSPNQPKVGLGQVLSALKQPLTDKEKLMVGRWKEIMTDDPEDVAFTIARSDRSYTYFVASPAFDEEGKEIAGKTERTLFHGVWEIENKRLYFLDLVEDGGKIEEPEIFINELQSLTKEGYLFHRVEGEEVVFKTRGLPVEKFMVPEMLPYNDDAALQSFDIRKAYNSAKGKGTEEINKFFSAPREPAKPANSKPGLPLPPLPTEPAKPEK